jgi:hypothetical protein
VNPVVNVAAVEGDTISATPGKADPGKRDSWVRKVLKVLGPGLVTGAADDDPSGIATYSSVGAQYGYYRNVSYFWVVANDLEGRLVVTP